MNSNAVPLSGQQLHAAGEGHTVSTGEAGITGPLTDEEVGSLISEGENEPPPIETPAPTPTTPPDDPEIEVPGVGKLKASQVRGLVAQQQVFQNLRRDKEALEAQAENIAKLKSEAEETRYIRSLLDHKIFRDKMQQALAEFVSSPDLGQPDGQGANFFQPLKNPVLEDLQEKYAELSAYVSTQQQQEAAADIEGVFDSYAERYPGVMTEETRQALVDAAVEEFADRQDTFQPSDLDRFVGMKLQEQILASVREQAKQEVLQSLGKQPTTARVVTGNHTRVAAKQPEVVWKDKDWRDITQSVAKDLYATE